MKERGIELSWSSTEKVLIPSVTDEVGEVPTRGGKAPIGETQEGEVPDSPNNDASKHDGEWRSLKPKNNSPCLLRLF